MAKMISRALSYIVVMEVTNMSATIKPIAYDSNANPILATVHTHSRKPEDRCGWCGRLNRDCKCDHASTIYDQVRIDCAICKSDQEIKREYETTHCARYNPANPNDEYYTSGQFDEDEEG